MAERLVVSVWRGASSSAEAPERVHVRLFASYRGSTVLWEDPQVLAFPDGPGRLRVVLGETHALPAVLVSDAPRFISVCSPDGAWSPRVPVDASALRMAVLLRKLDARVATLEQSVLAPRLPDAVGGLRDVVDEHERRLGQLEQTDPLQQLQTRAQQLAARLDHLDQEGGRLVRIEDELEDLVGPQGDVVDFEARLSRLERSFRSLRRIRPIEKHDPPA